MHSAKELYSLFKGLDRAYGQFIITEKQGAKVKGRAQTILGQVTVELWEKHLAGKEGLGIVPITDSEICYFGAIDIDHYDIDFNYLEEKINKFGFPLLLCTTKSGGAHLYIFSKSGIQAKTLRDKLTEWAGALGYPGIEIFPKQIKLASHKDVGNWINMPYFGGDDSNRYGVVDGKALSLAQFIDKAKTSAVTQDTIEQIKVPTIEGLEDIPPCLETLCRIGFPEGSRNNALFNMGVYARMRFVDDWEYKIDEYNRQYMTPGTAQEVVNIIKALKKKTYFYKCNEEPVCGYCNKTVCRQRKYGIGQSDEWNITIDTDCQKILTDPPYWVVSIEGVRIELTGPDLMQQHRFRLKCIEKINKVPSMMKNPAWDKTVQFILDSAEEIEAPKDAGAEGQLQFYLEQFCTQKAQARVREEMLSGKPYTEKGRTYFRSGDLAKYLDQQHFRELSQKDLYRALRKLGVEHHQLNAGNTTIQCWSIPAFDHSNPTLPIHRVEDGTGF